MLTNPFPNLAPSAWISLPNLANVAAAVCAAASTPGPNSLRSCAAKRGKKSVAQEIPSFKHLAEFGGRHAHGAGRNLKCAREMLAELAPQFFGGHFPLTDNLLKGNERAFRLVRRAPDDPHGFGDCRKDGAGFLAFQGGPTRGRVKPLEALGGRHKVNADARGFVSAETRAWPEPCPPRR